LGGWGRGWGELMEDKGKGCEWGGLNLSLKINPGRSPPREDPGLRNRYLYAS
jgi:hypothetical protein